MEPDFDFRIRIQHNIPHGDPVGHARALKAHGPDLDVIGRWYKVFRMADPIVSEAVVHVMRDTSSSPSLAVRRHGVDGCRCPGGGGDGVEVRDGGIN